MVRTIIPTKCKAQGKNNGHDCVTGAVYGEKGQIATATNCVFCGREKEENE